MQITQSPVAQNKRKPMPTPMIFILFWFGYSALSRLLTFGAVPMSVGPFVVPGLISALLTVASLTLSIACLVGIIMRSPWGRTLSLGWLAFQILFSLIVGVVSLLFMEETLAHLSSIAPRNLDAASSPLLIVGVIIGVIMSVGINGGVLYYIGKKKEYFNVPASNPGIES